MPATVDMIGLLFGAEKYPTMLVTNFCSKTMLTYFLLYCVFEYSAFREFGDHLALSSALASTLFSILRVVIIGLLGLIWWYKNEDGRETPKSGNSLQSHILHLQSAAILLTTFALSIQAAYDVFALNPLRMGLSSHALSSLAGLRQVTSLSFFVMRDTPIQAIIYAWGMGALVILGCCLYTNDNDQMAILLLYVVGSFLIFSDVLKQNQTMCGMIAKLQNTLKENEELAVEAQALELRAMIGNVAHDLKTPLTSFLSGIECMHDLLTEWSILLTDPAFAWTDECLLRCRAANKELLACLQNMNGANSFMTMSINRCLDYTKSSQGFKLVPTYETVMLEAKLTLTTQMIRNAHPGVDITVSKLGEGICSHVITDRQWLLENLLCLLSNAAKYSHKGHVDIAVALEKEGQFVRFEVQDTGIGLSDEAMLSLFNPFKQAQRLAGGTGLGLFSLAKRVEALHGEYGVMRRPDGEQGSLFWFTIPYRPDEQTARSVEQRGGSLRRCASIDVPDIPGTPRDRDGKEGPVFHVLVVDDAALIVKMTTMLLQRKGHTVEHAVNGADALEKLCAHTEAGAASSFDVVLMDLQMPVLDGIEAIRRLRAAEEKQRGPSSGTSNSGGARQFVIALSANSDEETKQEALAAGADAFMCKPFTYEEFSVTMAL